MTFFLGLPSRRVGLVCAMGTIAFVNAIPAYTRETLPMKPAKAPATENLTPYAVVVHNYVQSYVWREGEPLVFGSDSPVTGGKP